MAVKPDAVQNVKDKQAPFPWWIPAAGGGVVLVLVVVFLVTMMKVEESDTFCASCHTQPESSYVARMGAEAVDDASAHQSSVVRGVKSPGGTHCIDCHSGPGLGGRVAAEFLGARNAYLYFSRTMVQPARMTVPVADGNCLKCHADITASEDFKGANNHFHFLLARWRAAQPGQVATCVDCHAGHNDNGDPNLQFLERTQTEAVCTRCHEVLVR